VGEVVRLREQLNWFETRPLHGKTIVVTRSRPQASELVDKLAALGAEVLELQVIGIEPVDAGERMALLVAEGCPFEWVVFTSQNAVARFFEELEAAEADARLLAGCRLGAVGPATSAALREHGLRADFVPASFSAEAFAAEFPNARGPILFPCGKLARDTLPRGLAERGLFVETLPLYDTVLGGAEVDAVGRRLAAGEIHAITFTSSSTAENFGKLLPEADLTGVVLASIGRKTSATLRELGHEPTVEAAASTLDGLVAAVAGALTACGVGRSVAALTGSGPAQTSAAGR
ncbi:MAG: uroporphyrinogen-III synthase, partial [Rubrivivax sp.]|nr:uroporphyrinogen-III synthase [Rubrivivax sp.]